MCKKLEFFHIQPNFLKTYKFVFFVNLFFFLKKDEKYVCH